jgi:hypothetical protein
LAKEESDTPVVNPSAGSVVDEPVQDNPITTDITPPEATPLEVVDASQIPGVTVGEPAITPAQTGKPLPEQPEQTTPTQKPADTGPDLNQIAL